MVAQLVAQQGCPQRSPEDYDPVSALDREVVVRFVSATQTEEWAKLTAHYAASAEAEFFTQLKRACQQRGTLDVLRKGIKLVPGVRLVLCPFRPTPSLNRGLMRLYEGNILSVTRQVHYSPRNENAISAQCC